MIRLIINYPANLFSFLEYTANTVRYPNPAYTKRFQSKLSEKDRAVLKAYRDARISLDIPLASFEKAFAVNGIEDALAACPKRLRTFFEHFNRIFFSIWPAARRELINVRKQIKRLLEPIQHQVIQELCNVLEVKSVGTIRVYLVWNPAGWGGSVWADGVKVEGSARDDPKLLAFTALHEIIHHLDYRKGLNSYGHFVQCGFNEGDATALHEALVELLCSCIIKKYLAVKFRRKRTTPWLKQVAAYRKKIRREVYELIKKRRTYRETLQRIAQNYASQ